MNKVHVPLTILCILLVSTIGWGQLHLTIDEMPEANTYGIYVQACEDIVPSGNTITGSGQVTIVCPTNQNFSNLVSVAGLWQKNAEVIAPPEAPNLDYFSVGFSMDNPQIIYSNIEPTLLFTFQLEGGNGGMPYLIENGLDPFDQGMNSQNSNPGNELTAIDFGQSPTQIYSYSGNYLDNAVICDEVVMNDTTGNGVDTSIVVIDTTTNNIDTSGTGTGGENPSSTLDELASEGFFNLTPNPTQEWLNVIFHEEAIETTGTLRFWSVNGVALGELQKQRQEKMTLNVGALPAGIYFLSFESEGKMLQRERFLKQ